LERNVRFILGLSILSLLILAQASNVDAVTAQGLEWGVAVNDRINYGIAVTYHNATYDLNLTEQMYLIIDAVPVIPDNVSHLAQAALYEFTTYWDNGTVMDDFWNNFLLIMPFYVLPIGNWSLISELYGEIDPPVITMNEKSIFTVVWATNFDSTQVVLKSDGVLSYSYTEWNRIGMEDYLTIELTREGFVYPPVTTTTSSSSNPTTASNETTTPTQEGDLIYLLILGGVVGVVLIILIIILLRRR
jgi:hypothetical protein